MDPQRSEVKKKIDFETKNRKRKKSYILKILKKDKPENWKEEQLRRVKINNTTKTYATFGSQDSNGI